VDRGVAAPQVVGAMPETGVAFNPEGPANP